MLDILYATPSKDKNGDVPMKPMKWILLDSIIIGLIALVASMPSGVPDVNSCWIMFKAFLGAFIVELAIERGMKRKKAE